MEDVSQSPGRVTKQRPRFIGGLLQGAIFFFTVVHGELRYCS